MTRSRPVATYESLLRLYPPSFRNRFGDELRQTIRDYANSGDRVPWRRIYADLCLSAIGQRGKENVLRTKIAAAAFIVAVAGGGTFMVVGKGTDGGNGFSGFMIAGVLIALIGAVFVLGSRFRRGGLGAEHDYAPRRFHWWWVLAGLIGAFEAVVGAGQLIHDPKVEHVFALFVLGGFAALVFGGMKVRSRTAGNWMIATGVLPMLPVFWLIAPTLAALLVIVCALADNIRIARLVRPSETPQPRCSSRGLVQGS